MDDPTTAPTIAKQSLARAGNVFRAKPAAAAVDPPIPKGPQYMLLPPYTVRRFLRPKVRLRSGKRSMFAHPIRRIRPEVYKPLPEGWVWPPIPTQRDLPLIPRKKKRKRRIPQSVLDEWRGFSRPSSSREGPQQPPRTAPQPPSADQTIEGEEGASQHSNNELSDIDPAQGEIPDDEIPEEVRFLGFDDEN